MQFEEWLNVISSRKAIFVNSKGVEVIDKASLVIMQDNDIPRAVEMLRVLAETMQQIEDNADDEERVCLLVERIENHVASLIEIDPFKDYGKKKRKILREAK